MKKTGIWIDRRKAIIVSIQNGTEEIYEIVSNVEEFHVKGGSGTKSKGGPQDVVQDRKYLEREKHQLKAYFESIIPLIRNANAIVILGSAQTGRKFYKELSENYPAVFSNVSSVEKVDNMTDNQLKAWVREYFKSDLRP